MASGGLVGGPPLPAALPSTLRGHFRDWTGHPSDVADSIEYTTHEVIVTGTPFGDHGAQTDPASKDPTDYVTGSTECGLPGPCLGQGANAQDGYLPSSVGGSGVDGGANGSYRYPADPVYADNAANIVETRVAADSRAWYLLVRLNTLIDPNLTAVTAVIDQKHVLVAHGAVATLDGRRVAGYASTSGAFFEVRVPYSVYRPAPGPHAVFVAAGLWDTNTHTWYYPDPGHSPYYDLAYVPREKMDSYWHEAQQAADIEAQNYTHDAFTVNFGSLAHPSCGSCSTYVGPTHGLFVRVFRSGQKLGQGVTCQPRYGECSGPYTYNLYRAPWQPYAIYVPKHPTGAMVMLLHFLSGDYMSYSLTSMPALADWAEKLGVTVVMPEARGEGGWYESEAELDFFEVWRDVVSHYRIDSNRVYLAGMSMGGYGTWRLAELYPDLFSRAIVWSGLLTTQDDNMQDLFGNTSNVPLFVVHGALDPLVPVNGPETWMANYASVGHGTYRYLLYANRSHETTFPGTTERWVLSWLAGLPVRQTNPVRVSYKLFHKYQQPSFGISYDGAYWAHGMVLAPGAAEGSIDASRAPGPDRASVLPVQYGVDNLGPYRLKGTDVTPAVPVQNWVHVQLAGLSRAGLNTRLMGWSVAPQHIVGDTDRAVRLVLTGNYDRPLRVHGAVSKDRQTSVTLLLPRGKFDVTISDRARKRHKARSRVHRRPTPGFTG